MRIAGGAAPAGDLRSIPGDRDGGWRSDSTPSRRRRTTRARARAGVGGRRGAAAARPAGGYRAGGPGGTGRVRRGRAPFLAQLTVGVLPHAQVMRGIVLLGTVVAPAV